MKRTALTIAVVALVAWTIPANAASDRLITDIAAQTAGSLVYVTCEFEKDSATSAAAGPAICIDKSGLFLSLAFNASMRNAKVKECKIVSPGLQARPMSAELITIDRGTGMAFIKCTDPAAPKWTAVTFADKSDLSAGTEVVSVSLMPGDAGHARYYGRAHISTVRYKPQALAYVTGGSLTCVCSPVFTGTGKAIGLVWRQAPQIVELIIGRQSRVARIRPMRQCVFFTPVEEFIGVIKARGQRKLAWTGILALMPADKDVLRTSKPGIRVKKIIPGGPADKAKLKELDVIVGFNGEDLTKMPTPAMTVGNLELKLSRLNIGDKAVFKLANGETVTVTLEARPEGPNEVARYFNGRIGVLLRNKAVIDPHLGTSEALKADGVIVVSVGKNSPAVKADLQRGDVITSIDAQPVRSVATVRQLLKGTLADDEEKTIAVVVQRDDGSKSFTIKVPKKN